MRVHLYNDTQVAARVLQRIEKFGLKSMADATSARQKAQEGDTPGVIDSYVSQRSAEVYMKARQRTRVTLGALERVFSSLDPGTDRKSVLLVGEGFVLDPSEPDYRRVTEGARRANAAVYFLDTRGLEGLSMLYSVEFGTPPTNQYDVLAAIADTSNEAAGSEALADETGGFSVRDTNDLAGGIDRLARDSSTYYILGFTPAETTRDGRYRKLSVKVRGRNLRVRARRGYYAPSDDPALEDSESAKTDREMQRAIDSPFALDGIPVRMAAYVLEERIFGKARVVVVVDADLDRVQAVDGPAGPSATLEMLLAVAHRDSGEFFRDDQRIDLQLKPRSSGAGPAWYSVAREFDLQPGGYQAKVVVRDAASRRVGTLAHEFDVAPGNSLRISTPILTDTVQRTADQTGAAPVPLARRLFRPEGTLYCRFDVYGAGKKSDTGMPLVSAGHVLRVKDGPVVSRASPTLIAPTSLGTLSRMLQIPLAGLRPGDYELVLTVKDETSGRVEEMDEVFSVG
jgi:VWFA-related protein